jgi:hypothetical protein
MDQTTTGRHGLTGGTLSRLLLLLFPFPGRVLSISCWLASQAEWVVLRLLSVSLFFPSPNCFGCKCQTRPPTVLAVASFPLAGGSFVAKPAFLARLCFGRPAVCGFASGVD